MFDITPEDVARLDDKQLRDLVGILCESELRRKGCSTATVTYGGDQNAADGGLDVHVGLPAEAEIDGFIPRTTTGFQVKRQKMPPAAIDAEMAPRGVVRPSIASLADAGGAYVIVSSESAVSNSALMRRKAAMRAAVGDLRNARSLKVDFYDRSRIATWVRDNPSAILWVRKQIGRNIQGWQPYGAWSYPAGGLDGKYIVDQGVQIRPRPAKTDGDLSASDGISTLRKVLRNPRSVVRLVGLSGVGKTRFAQALFDERVGSDALDSTCVFYTNMSDAPDPQPSALASDMAAVGTRAILIVDNCPSDLHARLAEIVRAQSSQLSVLTVEYDIREDQPEGTDVYEIRAASIYLVEALLRNRFPGMSQVDAHTAAEFSGGNARVGIALAETVLKGGTLQHLTHDQLFRRLFVQRQDGDPRLLEIAQACSLVYSFEGENPSEWGELSRIGGMIGASADEVYKATSELLRRDLVQRRGVWRAVLPHAVANRLAATALQDIPSPRVIDALVSGAPERLQRSFTRRLGYLHESPAARHFVTEWFSAGGRLAAVWNLTPFEISLFENVLPVNPAAGLAAIERSLPRHEAEQPIVVESYLARALRSIAYNPELFERAMRMLQIICTEGESVSAKAASEIHASLFPAVLSGTHASIEQRVSVARALIESGGNLREELGLAGLSAMLKTSYFSSNHDFDFGAHSRDYGYRPRTLDDLLHWYRTALDFAIELAEVDAALCHRARAIIATNFRGLWTQTQLWDELERAALKLGSEGRFWRDGWQAVKKILRFDAKDKTSPSYVRLSALERRLRPVDLVQRVRGLALGSTGINYDIDEDELTSEDSFARAMIQNDAAIEALGEELARNAEALRTLLPDLVREPGALWQLGVGLARGADDPRRIWDALTQQFGAAGNQGDLRALCGLLGQLKTSHPGLAEELLEEALHREPLAAQFPRIQSFAGIDSKGVERLLRSLDLGRASIGSYYQLSIGRATDRMSAESLARFIGALGSRSSGENAALQILYMQFLVNKQEGRQHPPELIAAGRNLLVALDFSRYAAREDHILGGVVRACLSGEGGYAAAQQICERLLFAVEAHTTSGVGHNELLTGLLETQPHAVLDTLLGDAKKVRQGIYLIQGASQVQSNPLGSVSEAVLIEWANHDPSSRYCAIASVAEAIRESRGHSGWNPFMTTLVHDAPEPIAVMQRIIERVDSLSWSGSEASALESRAQLLDVFDLRGNEALTRFVAGHKKRLLAEAERARVWERDRDKSINQTFE